MSEDIVRSSARNVNEVRDINRDLMEQSLQMRCLAYLSKVKAMLLTETIFEVDSSKKNLRELNYSLVNQNELISEQKEEIQIQLEELTITRLELEKANAALEEKNRELERFNKLFIDREFRIRALKDRVNELELAKTQKLIS